MYLTTVNTRAKGWRMLCEKPTKSRLEKAVGGASAEQQEKVWNIITHVHFHVKDVQIFINTLVELVIEERVTFTSFADPEKIRNHMLCDLENLSDESLMFVFYALRDGERYLLL